MQLEHYGGNSEFKWPTLKTWLSNSVLIALVHIKQKQHETKEYSEELINSP